MNLLDLFVKISVDDQASEQIGGIAGGIKEKAVGALGAAGKAATVAGGAAVAAGAAVAKEALDSFGEFEQLAGGIEKLYGDSADIVMQNAQQAYRTAGMSANEYMENAMSISASLINSLDGDTQAAAELTDVAMRAISDNVNTFGRDAEAVTNAVIGMSRGNYTMLDNLSLGYAGTAQGMLDLINDSGVLGEELTSTSQLADVGFGTMIEALQAVQEEQGIAGTTATEAATTLEGSMNSTKAAWTNLVTELGKDDGDVGARLEELVGSVTDMLLGAVDETGNQVSDGILGKLGTIFSNMLEMAPELLQTGIGLFSQLINALAEASPQIVDALANCIGELLGVIVDNIPALLAAAGNLFVQFVTALTEKREEVTAQWGEMLGQLVSDIAGKVEELLGEAMNLFGQLLVAAGETVTAIPGKVTEIIGAITGGLADAVTEVFTGAQVVVGQIIAAISSILTGENSVGTKIGKVISAIMDAFGPTAVSDMLTKAGEVIGKVPQAIGDAVSSVTEKIGEVVTEITSPFNGIDLFSVGSSIIQGLIDGINSLAQSAIDTVGGIIQGIADLLPHSPAKKGPFSGKGWTLYSGRSIMDALAEGIEDSADSAVTATEAAVGRVYGATSGTVSVSSAANGQDAVLVALNAILAAIPEAVYLDGKALVGNLAPQMDYAMGGLM